MSMTGLEVFDTTIQKTNSWLKDLMERLDWEDRRRAYRALRATLHALRDRLRVDEVAQLSAQLPMLIRGFYYEGWDPTNKPEKLRQKEQFIARIKKDLADDISVDAELVAKEVFFVMSQRLSQGEIEDIKQVLPAEIRDLWPPSRQVA